MLKHTQSISKEQKLVIRSLADNLIADKTHSVKTGCELRDPVRRPDLLVRALKKAKILPRCAEYSAEPFVISGILRTALCGLQVSDLYSRREKIEDWVDFESGFMHSGDEAFRLLCNMLMHGYKAGLGKAEDCALSLAAVEFCKIPSNGEALLRGEAPDLTNIKLLSGF